MKELIRLMNKRRRRVVGVMSGTSLDGVDIVLVGLRGSGLGLDIDPIHFATYPMPDSWRGRIQNAFNASTEEICKINFDLGTFFGNLIVQFFLDYHIKPETVDIIGIHGQTLFHVDRHSTLQAGEADVVAELTGRLVISDFRTADIAVGGSGAPLVPYLDQILFKDRTTSLALQNIGGIGNVTYLPQQLDDDILAFDTGPGNAILNELVEFITDSEHSYDRNGFLSKQGNCRPEIRDELLRHPYFAQELPKSTGRELFGKAYAQNLMKEYAAVPPLDLLRTCVSMVAHSMVESYERFLPGVDKIFVSGGGAHHPLIMDELKILMGKEKVAPLGTIKNVTIDSKEAVAFAVLAHERINGAATNMPSVTGARKNTTLGKITIPMMSN